MSSVTGTGCCTSRTTSRTSRTRSRRGSGSDAGGDAAAWTRLSTRWWSDRRIHRVTHRRRIELILDGLGAALRGKVAVTETVLEGPVVTLHRWFLPRAFVRYVEQHGYDLRRAVPDALVIPWAERGSVWLASRRLPYHLAFMAYFGFGTHFVFKQSPESDWSDVWT